MKTENKGVGFDLQGIKTEQFAIFEDNYTPKKVIGLNTSLQFKVDSQNKQMGVFLGFEYIQGKKIFLKIIVSCHFKIEKNDWNSFIQDDKLIVPKGFLAHLAMITIGTTRGVLFAKTESTPFSKYIVPTINVEEMIEKDAIFEINSEE
jgi:hypothetical protein